MENNYELQLKREWEEFTKKEFLPNIMLLGITGSGKSSLINLVFNRNIALVNDVSRGTDDFKTYRGKDYGMGVNLIDSRGYEMEDGAGESFAYYCESIKKKMIENRTKRPLEKIHMIWFCISVAAEKVQPYDIEILKFLLQEPELRERVAVVLTKCDEDDEDGNTAKIFRKIIADEVGRSVPVFEVSTDEELLQELDLEKLITWSVNTLDDKDLKDAFLSAQVISLREKRTMASERIGYYAFAAGAIGAVPIPISDAALLMPLQLTMSSHIIRIYGMENLVNISKAVIGSVLIPNLGRAMAGGLLKLIPGLGQIAGGIINAGVASLITSALGFAISELCYDSCRRIAQGENVDFGSVFDVGSIRNLVQEYMDSHNE